jgi:hypothetical protein
LVDALLVIHFKRDDKLTSKVAATHNSSREQLVGESVQSVVYLFCKLYMQIVSDAVQHIA